MTSLTKDGCGGEFIVVQHKLREAHMATKELGLLTKLRQKGRTVGEVQGEAGYRTPSSFLFYLQFFY